MANGISVGFAPGDVLTSETMNLFKDQFNDTIEDTLDVVAATQHLVGGKDIPFFSETDEYYRGDLVFYKADGDDRPKTYRCDIQNEDAPYVGPWSNIIFTETTLYQEIMRISSSEFNYGTVKVKVNIASGSHAVDNLTVSLTYFDGTARTATTDEDGIAIFTGIPYGTTYTITGPDLTADAYYKVKNITDTCNVQDRMHTFNYFAASTETLILYYQDNAIKTMRYDLWDGSLNHLAIGVRAQSSTRTVTIKARPTAYSPSGLSWASNSLPSYGNTRFAAMDVATNDADNGRNNQTRLEQWLNNYNVNRETNAIEVADYAALEAISSPDTTKVYKTLDDGNMYVYANSAWGPYSAFTLQQAFPAFYFCKSQTIVLGSTTYTGYLPSKNEIKFLSDQLTHVNAALQACGSGWLAGGASYLTNYWWSSSQNSASGAWYLSNGTLDFNYRKYGSYSVLPFFDL